MIAEIDLVTALVAGNVAQAAALTALFLRMERLVKRGQDREDKLMAALLGQIGQIDGGQS